MKQEAIFSTQPRSKVTSNVVTKLSSLEDSHAYNTTGKGKGTLPTDDVTKQLHNHINHVNNQQVLKSRFADVNNMENPRPSNYEHLKNILPETFNLEGIVRDRITSFAQVMNTLLQSSSLSSSSSLH